VHYAAVQPHATGRRIPLRGHRPGPTWVLVARSRPGWDRALLPTRPDRSTGWIYLGGGELQTASTPYQVNVNLATYRLAILDAGPDLGTWTVAPVALFLPQRAFARAH